MINLWNIKGLVLDENIRRSYDVYGRQRGSAGLRRQVSVLQVYMNILYALKVHVSPAQSRPVAVGPAIFRDGVPGENPG